MNLLTGAVSVLIADAAPTVSDPLPGWAQYGVLGMLIIAWLTGFVVRGKDRDQAVKERDDERKRTDAAEEAAKALMMEKVFPALTAYQLSLQNVNDVLMPTIDKIVDRLDALERAAERADAGRQGG